MRLLLDTHALIWWLAGDAALSDPARTAIADEANAVFVSAASAWEIATKHRSGRLPSAAELVTNLDAVTSERHGRIAGGLPGPHRDPFDRMLIAQAMEEKLLLVSNEEIFDTYGVGRLW